MRDGVFERAPFLVSWSATYRNWREDRARESALRDRLAALIGAGHDDTAFAELSQLGAPEDLRAKLIAFYLPQFHPIAENDTWWGKGFTEWTNVQKAKPRFEGHDQPRRPGELGYYDLVEQPLVRRRQAALARQYGLSAFCFYYYWFDGKTLLEEPIRQYANDASIDFPFCLCWANETWSRRWDGRPEEVLIAQNYGEDKDQAFIASISGYLRHPNYLRIGGRPMLLLYRPGDMPDAKASVDRWRDWCRLEGIGEIFVAYVQSFDSAEPAIYGCDAAVEFPPNNLGLVATPGRVATATDPYMGPIYDYDELIKTCITRDVAGTSLFRGVTPQWDNTPRRDDRGTVVQGATPAKYQAWLSHVIDETANRFTNPDDRLVFINAWNEWAEGAYLEPDEHRGYAFLDATRKAVSPKARDAIEPRTLVADESPEDDTGPRKIIVVVHDFHRHGAQFLALNMVRTLKLRFGFDVAVISCGDGPLERAFAAHACVHKAKRGASGDADMTRLANRLVSDGFRHAIVNSSASGWTTTALSAAGIGCVGLVHELPEIIERMDLAEGVRSMDAGSLKVVFASEIVRDMTAQAVLGRSWRNAVILPQGLYKRDGLERLEGKDEARLALARQFGLDEHARFVVGAGYGDHRKGIDIFVDWAAEVCRDNEDMHFVWAGGIAEDIRPLVQARLGTMGSNASRVHFPGFLADTRTLFSAADAYALTSREDPFPSTAIEALSVGTSVFAVSGCTGLQTLVDDTDSVIVLPDATGSSFAEAFRAAREDRDRWTRRSQDAIRIAHEKFGFVSYMRDLLELLDLAGPRVSVVVPNFNYARHLSQRLSSIIGQSEPVWEIIFLDDASTDDSVDVARRLLSNCGINYKIVTNAANSGSVFRQWARGASLAAGDILWIAEADDWAGRDFLKVAGAPLRHGDVHVSYVQSHQVSEQGNILCAHYLDYVSDISPGRWRSPYLHDGRTELAEGFSVKNTIPNVSAALFRRSSFVEAITSASEDLDGFRVAGDWRVYAELLMSGRIAFHPQPLNFHRRHSESVTLKRFGEAEWLEIARMQELVARRVDVPSDLQTVARQYLAHLRRQFGLPDRD